MKNKDIKSETFEVDTLYMEHEINFSHILKLLDLLNGNQSDYLIIKMKDVIKGSFANAIEFSDILHSSNRKIIIMCSGIINLTGVIPLFANHDNDKIVFHDAKFILNLIDYKENYVEPEYQNKFNEIIIELLDRNTLLTSKEITALTHTDKVFSAEEFMELGIVEDIYSMLTDNKSDSNIIKNIIMRKEIFERRNERDKMKCEGRLLFTPICNN